jgi:hypothetical protein
MGVLDTTYTFTATDVVTSAKLNNVIDQTTFTSSAIATGNNTLAVTTSGQLKVNSSGITANELGDNSVITAKILDANVTTAKILNSNVTAEKLSGSQSGSAPIFGARAYGSFNGQATSPITPIKAGNVTSITRTSTGIYQVVMTIPMESSSYCVVANATHPGFVSYASNCYIQFVNSTTFNIVTGYFNYPSTSALYNSENVNFAVFQ